MRAAWYERNGPAADVLQVGELPVPEPGPGEVRLRVVASGLNPTDVKARAGSRPMGFPRVVPHQDGARGEGQERREDDIDRGPVRDHVVRDPMEAAAAGRNGPRGVDERVERLAPLHDVRLRGGLGQWRQYQRGGDDNASSNWDSPHVGLRGVRSSRRRIEDAVGTYRIHEA